MSIRPPARQVGGWGVSPSESSSETSKEEDASGKNVRRELEPIREGACGGLVTGGNGASLRASQQTGGSVVNQAASRADKGIGGIAPLDLSHGSKEDAPRREARRKGEPQGRHPQGVPAPPRARNDKEGGNKEEAGSKGSHQTKKAD